MIFSHVNLIINPYNIDRYKLSANWKDVNPNEVTKEIIGQFMFLGANGTTLRGQKAVLGVATIRGRTDYMLPDANNITFHVWRSELINNASRATTSTTNSKSSENTDKSIVLNSSEGIVDPQESSRNSDTAPTTDVMQPTLSDPEKVNKINQVISSLIYLLKA
jgi:hypothetical protein